MTLVLPRYDKRLAILGSTGSGKTVFGIWMLSHTDYHIRPWFIFDFKGDELIEGLPTVEISLNNSPPKEPGLYVLRPLPGDEKLLSNFFCKLWEQENCGVYIDEGYMIPKNDRWYRALLTQGRSKHIQMIVLSQRPVWMDKFTFTEANYFAVFNLNNDDDRDHVKTFLNRHKPQVLPRHHCLWYDVDNQRTVKLSPVPPPDEILDTFYRRVDNKPIKL